jgi:hypothetical protein
MAHPAPDAAQQHNPGSHDGFGDDPMGHLRLSEAPFGVTDRNLNDSGAVEFEQKLRKKCVTGGFDLIEAYTLEDACAVSTKAARTVDACQAAQPAHITVGGEAEQQALHVPVQDSNAAHVPRADGDVGSAKDVEQSRQIRWAVREVGIQRQNEIVSVRDSVTDSRDRRRSITSLSRTGEHRDPVFALAHVAHDLGGAVWRVVVDDQNRRCG